MSPVLKTAHHRTLFKRFCIKYLKSAYQLSKQGLYQAHSYFGFHCSYFIVACYGLITCVKLFLMSKKLWVDSWNIRGHGSSKIRYSNLDWLLKKFIHSLSICAWFSKYRVWWNRFFPTLNWIFAGYSGSLKNSIANSSLFLTSLYLHLNSTQILALKKKMVFLKKKIFPTKKYFF